MLFVSRGPTGRVELYVPVAAWGCRSDGGSPAPLSQQPRLGWWHSAQQVLTNLLLKYPRSRRPSLGLPEALLLSLLSLPLWVNLPSCCQMWLMLLMEEGGPLAWHSCLSPSGLEQLGIVFPNGFMGL